MSDRHAKVRNIYRLLDSAFGEGKYPAPLGTDLDCLRWNHPKFAENLDAVLGSDNTISREEMELFLHGVRSELRGHLQMLANDVCSAIDQLIGPDDEN